MRIYIFLLPLLFCFTVCRAQSADFYNTYFEGNSLLVKGQYSKAIENYNKALKEMEADYLYFNRGNAYMGKKDYTHAMADFNKVLSMNKDYTEAYCQRGLIKTITGDKTACDDLKKASRLNSREARIAMEQYCDKKK